MEFNNFSLEDMLNKIEKLFEVKMGYPLKNIEEIKAKYLENTKASTADKRPVNTFNSSVPDQLREIKKDIEKLVSDITNFKGPHLNREYRILNHKCGELQIRLDKINIQSNEQWRKEKRGYLLDIDAAADKLGENVHKDGKKCPKCD